MTVKLLILLAFISCSVSGKRTGTSPSSDCPDVLVSGYLVRKFKKEEIESIQRNRELKEQGKSYGQAIDYYEEVFFVPLDSLSATRNLSGLLNKNINFYNKQVFFFPSDETQTYIKKLCGRETTMNGKVSKGDKYFVMANDQERKYLYGVQYLEGKAVHAKSENNHFNQRYFGLRYRIDSSLKLFDCYFVHSIVDVKQQIPSDENIKEWKFEN
jgi:hypothetical protein